MIPKLYFFTPSTSRWVYDPTIYSFSSNESCFNFFRKYPTNKFSFQYCRDSLPLRLAYYPQDDPDAEELTFSELNSLYRKYLDIK